MTDITLKHLQAFVTVADLGSFRRAAERLNTTQPNISNRIAQLEERLKTSLMDRDSGSIRLTPKGDTLLVSARSVLGAFDSFIATAGDESLFEDTLRLGVSELVAHTWLRPFLLAMRERFESVQVELTVDLSVSLTQALFDRELDLVFQNGPFDRESLGCLPLGRSPYVWVAASDSDLPDRKLLPEEILTQPILTHARGSVPWRELDAHFRQLSPGIRKRVRLVPSSNIATCLQMTVDGLGIACLPEDLLATAMAEGRLRRLDYAWQPDALNFAARHNADPMPTVLQEAIQVAQRLSPPDEG